GGVFGRFFLVIVPSPQAAFAFPPPPADDGGAALVLVVLNPDRMISPICPGICEVPVMPAILRRIVVVVVVVGCAESALAMQQRARVTPRSADLSRRTCVEVPVRDIGLSPTLECAK